MGVRLRGKVKRRVRGTHLVSLNLTLGVILKRAVPLDSALDELPELSRKDLGVVEVVDPKTGSRGLGRVAGSDTSSGSADTAKRRRER